MLIWLWSDTLPCCLRSDDPKTKSWSLIYMANLSKMTKNRGPPKGKSRFQRNYKEGLQKETFWSWLTKGNCPSIKLPQGGIHFLELWSARAHRKNESNSFVLSLMRSLSSFVRKSYSSEYVDFALYLQPRSQTSTHALRHWCAHPVNHPVIQSIHSSKRSSHGFVPSSPQFRSSLRVALAGLLTLPWMEEPKVTARTISLSRSLVSLVFLI